MDRVDTARGRGGGLLVYAGEEIRILKEDKKVNFHQCCHFNVYDVSVCLKYRSPNAPPEAMKELVDLVKDVGKNTVLIGDFNLSDINWDTGKSSEIRKIKGVCGRGRKSQ